MSLGQQLAPHLPFLRRYARALTGSQSHGDHYVRATLEAIVATRPDIILVSEGSLFAEDQGRAMLLHPALEQLYPPDKRIVLPERLTVCGGPMLGDALDRLTAELERVSGK